MRVGLKVTSWSWMNNRFPLDVRNARSSRTMLKSYSSLPGSNWRELGSMNGALVSSANYTAHGTAAHREAVRSVGLELIRVNR
jgi:hypothetical protein